MKNIGNKVLSKKCLKQKRILRDMFDVNLSRFGQYLIIYFTSNTLGLYLWNRR